MRLGSADGDAQVVAVRAGEGVRGTDDDAGAGEPSDDRLTAPGSVQQKEVGGRRPSAQAGKVADSPEQVGPGDGDVGGHPQPFGRGNRKGIVKWDDIGGDDEDRPLPRTPFLLRKTCRRP